MGKTKIYEIAKEVNQQSKDVVTFLKDKGIEVKAAQSSIDDEAVQMVRNKFAAGVKSEIVKEKVEVKPAVKTEAKPEVKADDSQKKKKKIIIVNNQQNSKIPSQRPTNNNQGNRGGGQPVRTQQPIKPLTPPSPTPAVNMQSSTPMQPKAEKVETVRPATKPQATAGERDHRGNYNSNNQTNGTGGGYNNNRNNGTGGGYNNNRNNGTEGGYNNNRNNGTGGGYNNNRNNGTGGGYNNNRNNGTEGGYNNNRNNGTEGGYNNNRNNGTGGGYNNNRNNGTGGGYNNNRNNGTGGGYNNNRNNGTEGGYNNNRNNGTGGGYNNNRNNGTGGGYNNNRNNGTGGGYNNNRNNGTGGGYNNRNNGTGGGYNNRPGGYNNNGGGKFYDKDKDERDTRGGQNAGDRTKKAGPKGFDASVKEVEKHRNEEARRINQEKDKRGKKDFIYEDKEALINKPGRFIKPEKKKEDAVEEVIKVIYIDDIVTIKELAEKMKIQPSAIVKKLFLEGRIVTLNQEISYEEAETIAMEYEILCEKEVKVDIIEELLKEEDENEEELVGRAPVICVMGHVDHGKTSLLDAIRKTNVTDREAGGITQHIGAYTVSAQGKQITFLDTPGHEAFTAMRMRGANATDIAILVVAADDGVMPQTIEAINHAKAAGIEIIVAVNKIDKPSANIDRVKQELLEYELTAEDWGGSTVFAPVSAKSGEGIEELLEMILLSADILELKANPKRRVRGLVIEAELDKGRGPVATILVQKGTLKVGDFVSAGASYGKVRAMIDDKGARVTQAGPSVPVEILGLSSVPKAGEVFISHENDKTAKSYAETYMAQNKEKMLEETKSRMSLDDLFSQIQEGNLKELNLIVKADVQGSVEAVKQSLLKLKNDEVVVKCIHGGVGAVNESDVMLASASKAIIIGFNVRPDVTAKAIAEREGVDLRLYKVIYQAIADIEAAMKGMLDPVFEEKVIGHAEVRQIFRASAIGNIAGSYVLDGQFQRGCKVRISRQGEQIFEGELASLKRFKDDVKEVKSGFECGLVFEGFDKVEELDIVEGYIMVEVPR